METGNMPDRSNNISVSIGLQNVMDRYGTDQKAIWYNRNLVLKYLITLYNQGIESIMCLLILFSRYSWIIQTVC